MWPPRSNGPNGPMVSALDAFQDHRLDVTRPMYPSRDWYVDEWSRSNRPAMVVGAPISDQWSPPTTVGRSGTFMSDTVVPAFEITSDWGHRTTVPPSACWPAGHVFVCSDSAPLKLKPKEQ